MGEGDVFKSPNSKTTTDSGDTNWDINDPDIPARIDQYVSIKMVIVIMSVSRWSLPWGDYMASINPVSFL